MSQNEPDYQDITNYVVENLLPIYTPTKNIFLEQNKLIKNWVKQHPSVDCYGQIVNNARSRINKLITDEKLNRSIQRTLEARYPAYRDNKIKEQKEAAFKKFDSLPMPSKDDCLRAFAWFLCPGTKDEFDANLIKFDAFMKHLANTILPDVDFDIKPTMMLFYSAEGNTGKTYRTEGIEDAVRDLGFPVMNTTAKHLFASGFHSDDDFIDGLCVINEWSNEFNMADDLLKNLIEQKPIRYDAKYKNATSRTVKSCIAGASNYRVKTSVDRRISLVSFAESPIPKKGEPDYKDYETYEKITETERRKLFYDILKVYLFLYRFTKLPEKNITKNSIYKNQSFIMENLVNSLNVDKLNTQKTSGGFKDKFMEYVESIKTDFGEPAIIKTPNCRVYCSKRHYKFSPKEYEAIIQDLLSKRLIRKISKDSYEVVKGDKDDVLSELMPQYNKDRYSYLETYKLLEEKLDFSFLQDDEFQKVNQIAKLHDCKSCIKTADVVTTSTQPEHLVQYDINSQLDDEINIIDHPETQKDKLW